jgi:hypothetical protein
MTYFSIWLSVQSLLSASGLLTILAYQEYHPFLFMLGTTNLFPVVLVPVRRHCSTVVTIARYSI